MALSWWTVLQSVPWAEVIANAPKVADGAKKLWTRVARQPVPAGDAAAATPVAPDAGGSDAVAVDRTAAAVDALATRVAALEANVAELHGQMLASSQLIDALAEQNRQLVAVADAARRRARWLVIATGVAAALALAALALAGAPWWRG